MTPIQRLLHALTRLMALHAKLLGTGIGLQLLPHLALKAVH